MADALREAYASLYVRNEYMHSLSDDELRGLIIAETGAGDDSVVPTKVLASINALKAEADFSADNENQVDEVDEIEESVNLPQIQLPSNLPPSDTSVGLNLSYTINLNLPATADIAVFNAIFKSLKENLLKDIR